MENVGARLPGAYCKYNKECIYEPAMDMATLGYSNGTVPLSNGTTFDLWCIAAYYVNAGDHYHYNMSKSLECTPETLKPFFLLEYSNQFVGTGLMLFTKHKCGSNWYEFPNALGPRINLPDGPDCLFEFVKQYGIVTIHTYFVEKLYLITCLFQ